jgi:hypothetical protein
MSEKSRCYYSIRVKKTNLTNYFQQSSKTTNLLANSNNIFLILTVPQPPRPPPSYGHAFVSLFYLIVSAAVLKPASTGQWL